MCFEFDYLVSTDGGATANGTADSFGFGSYHLESRTGHKQMVRLEFGRGVTNNEAEYRTLIAGLKDLAGRIERAGKSASDYSLLVSMFTRDGTIDVHLYWSTCHEALGQFSTENRATLPRFLVKTVGR